MRDEHDVITYWNRGAEELYGWTKEEAIGTVAHTRMQTVFPAPLPDIMAELTRTGRWEGELVHTRRDGTPVVVASRWSLRRGAPAGPPRFSRRTTTSPSASGPRRPCTRPRPSWRALPGLQVSKGRNCK